MVDVGEVDAADADLGERVADWHAESNRASATTVTELADGAWALRTPAYPKSFSQNAILVRRDPGADTLIASGREANVLPRLARGEALGTLLFASATPLAARKQWLADHLQLAGSLILDAGAVKALAAGKSLLPVGVTAVEGEFERGAAVACRTADGREIARGLVNYSSSEARRIARRPSSEIESLLGYLDEPELIHRDNLVLL